MNWTVGKSLAVVAAAGFLGLSLWTGTLAADEDLQVVEIKLPKPAYAGTPKVLPPGIKLDPKEKVHAIRPPWKAPTGTKNVAEGKPVTSSDKEPIIGKLEQITDGDKEGIEGNWVELAPQLQWVQIDLQKATQIYGVLVWHHHADPRVYHAVVIQVSDDPDFINDVKTIYNNDYNNSAGLGIGKEYEYFETYQGRLIESPKGGVKGRYVRLYSKGNTTDDQNHYTEVEVYGIAN